MRTFTALHVLPRFRGVKRFLYRVSSTVCRTLSIQPKQSASSTASGQVMLGTPLAFLWKPTTSSVSVSWLASSHARNSAGVAK